MKKIFSFLLFLGVTNLSALDRPLTVGTASGYAPYVYVNERGEYEGFDVDMAALLSEKLGRPLRVRDCGSMTGLILSLRQGKVDCLLWAISMTPKRAENMEMVYYQGKRVSAMPLVFWKEVPEGISSFRDLTKTVCVEAGSYQEEVLRRYPDISLKYLDGVNEVIRDLKYGKSQACCLDPDLAFYLCSKYPELKTVNVPLEKEEQSPGNGIAVSRSNPDLAEEIRRAVLELRAEGKIEELEKKWGLTGV